jgi:mono/diheme cytochrome c family protein
MAVFDPATQTMSQAIPVPEAVLSADFAVAPISHQLAILSTGNAHTQGMETVPVFSLDDVVSSPPSSVDLGNAPLDGGTDTGGGSGGGGGGVGGCGIISDASSNVFGLGEPIALGYDNAEHLWVQMRDPAVLVRSDGSNSIKLATDSMADTGWAVFHSNSGAGVMCVSCHPEGGDDSRTWNFQDVGTRRTQTLRGHVGGTEPFHWSGDLSNFGALLGEVYIKRMSGPTLLDDQSAALFAWINTIPELPQSPPADPAAVARGQTLFSAPDGAGCATCHNGVEMTNNLTLNVGTGGEFQVPRLIGVAWRAPFMHDGCAATLTDRFGVCGGGDTHGLTSKLTTAQISDLVAYLETL